MLLPRALRRLPRPPHRPLSTTSGRPPAPLKPRRPPAPPATPYTATDLTALRTHFTPSQLHSLLAAETSISPSDFGTRIPRHRSDPMALSYLDDLASYDPILDFPDPALPRVYVPGHPLQPLPVLPDPFASAVPGAEGGGETAAYVRDVCRKTGLSRDRVLRLRHRILVSHRVVNQTHMGKIGRIYSLAVAGNGDGLVGIGEGKAAEFEDSHRMATYMAMRNLEPVQRYEGRTIFGDVQVKVGAVELGLFSRPPGFGVRCSQYVFEIARCAGIQDLSARATRSRNPMNVIKATMHALRSQRLPETIARGRGKKFVDVRKVYYNGMV